MKNGDREAYYQIKGLRTKVYRNTIDLVTQGHYTTEDGKRVELGDGAEMMNATVYYDHEIETDAPTADETCIEVVNDDCLAVAMRLKADGYTPAVLNMANRHHPGGGVDNGAAAQEETLFRRTDLYRSLYRFSPLAKVYGLPPSSHHYPLDSHFGGIYTPGATIFRESEDQGYRLMAEPVSMDFISVAGKNRPDLTPRRTDSTPPCACRLRQDTYHPAHRTCASSRRSGAGRFGLWSLLQSACPCGATLPRSALRT